MNVIFYGVILDKNDPFLGYNLDRLEKRFRERYLISLEKKRVREQDGKLPHQTILKSIENNLNKFIMVKVIRTLILNECVQRRRHV